MKISLLSVFALAGCVDLDTPEVVSQRFEDGVVRIELDQAIEPDAVRLVTVRSDASGSLEVIEAAGDTVVEGNTLSIELRDTPQPNDVYRAIATVGGDEVDLGTIVFPGTLDALAVGSSFPADGQSDVDRNIARIVVTYTESEIDCANPFTGVSGFHLYSVDPALSSSRQQNMYPNMPVGFGTSPSLVCDEARNQISMVLPGYLLGGTTFRVDTSARAQDGTMISRSMTFRTKNPGLKTYLTKVTNEIYECDTRYPFSTSYRCDIYVVGMVKTRAAQAWQINSKFPTSGDWSNWAEDTSRTFGSAPPVLSSDAQAIGDAVAIELHAYDSDSSDGATKGLTAIGGLGKVSSSFVPPSGTIAEGLIQSATSLPVGGDDFAGGGSYFVSRAKRWGTVKRNHTFKLPGRPTASQIVVDFVVEEFPAPWYAPAIVL